MAHASERASIETVYSLEQQKKLPEPICRVNIPFRSSQDPACREPPKVVSTAREEICGGRLYDQDAVDLVLAKVFREVLRHQSPRNGPVYVRLCNPSGSVELVQLGFEVLTRRPYNAICFLELKKLSECGPSEPLVNNVLTWWLGILSSYETFFWRSPDDRLVPLDRSWTCRTSGEFERRFKVPIRNYHDCATCKTIPGPRLFVATRFARGGWLMHTMCGDKALLADSVFKPLNWLYCTPELPDGDDASRRRLAGIRRTVSDAGLDRELLVPLGSPSTSSGLPLRRQSAGDLPALWNTIFKGGECAVEDAAANSESANEEDLTTPESKPNTPLDMDEWERGRETRCPAKFEAFVEKKSPGERWNEQYGSRSYTLAAWERISDF